ncbi:hypothetical protein BpHYR1_001828 [Brachionus plicatilis]|uniref:Uncharacterized protein n=1 Tax=Brachionus plicatilis TaxID=10195 RepID=A0A3M7SL52_BRAPC|nr:hypothetical protein BpHYR1_001828 [Brachionus plicatilis]
MVKYREFTIIYVSYQHCICLNTPNEIYNPASIDSIYTRTKPIAETCLKCKRIKHHKKVKSDKISSVSDAIRELSIVRD